MIKNLHSPNWLIDRTFQITFCFEAKPPKPAKPRRSYRNPIYLAKEYASMIETGDAKSESDLARKLGISRVRVNQIVRLLKLDGKIIEAIEQLGDPLPKQNVTERMLRPYVQDLKDKQDILLDRLFDRGKFKENF